MKHQRLAPKKNDPICPKCKGGKNKRSCLLCNGYGQIRKPK